MLLCLSLLSCKKNTPPDLIVFDVNGNFPVKTLDIQDVTEIEYLTLELEFDWNELEKGFPTKGYLMEKHSGKFFQTKIQMCDFKGKELILGSSVIGKTLNDQTGIITSQASELQAANEENRLSGKLKEVTDRLTENDECVYMILKFK